MLVWRKISLWVKARASRNFPWNEGDLWVKARASRNFLWNEGDRNVNLEVVISIQFHEIVAVLNWPSWNRLLCRIEVLMSNRSPFQHLIHSTFQIWFPCVNEMCLGLQKNGGKTCKIVGWFKSWKTNVWLKSVSFFPQNCCVEKRTFK